MKVKVTEQFKNGVWVNGEPVEGTLIILYDKAMLLSDTHEDVLPQLGEAKVESWIYQNMVVKGVQAIGPFGSQVRYGQIWLVEMKGA